MIHEIAAEIFEITEDETSPEIHDIADSGFERAANFLLTLCQQNEMEKHGKSNEIQRQIETETWGRARRGEKSVNQWCQKKEKSLAAKLR